MGVTILIGDVRDRLRDMPADSVDCVVTSPPYWGLRDYGVDGQIGLEPTLGEHLSVMVAVFEEVRRVLKPTGTLWLNYGDCYATSPNGRSAADTKAAGTDDRTFRDKPFSTIQGVLKAKDLCMVPNRLAIALQEAGWWVRSEIIWAKPNPMPESINDRPATSHEKIFLLSKAPRYYYDADAVRQGRTSDEDANTFRGGAYTGGNTDNATTGKRKVSGNTRVGGRPQRARAEALATEKGLTESHFEAIRACGISDAGKALVTTNGAGQNTAEMMRLAAEAKDALGGYYREFLFQGGRNLRNYEPAPMQIWPIATAAFSQAHFATFPPELAERCLLAGCPKGGTVLDPFGGAGTTALVADRMGLDCTIIELNPEYAEIARRRISTEQGMFQAIEVAA